MLMKNPKKAFADLQREKNEAKLKAFQMYFPSGGPGLPQLAAQPTSSPSAGGYTVNAGGKTYNFPTAESAEKFKRDAGVQ